MHDLPYVITIDGTGGVGKGTVASKLAEQLGWHILDSGVLYRVAAWAALHYQINPGDEQALSDMIAALNISMLNDTANCRIVVLCDDNDITTVIRTHECGTLASKISSKPLVRMALLQQQRDYRQFPGLVTDGRDMGTVVFPDATVKFFFTADIEERAIRRVNQLKEKGINVSLPEIREQLESRDARDSNRSIAPLKPAEDAILIDTTHSSIDEVLEKVMMEVQKRI